MTTIIELPVGSIRAFVKRARPKAGFDRMKRAIQKEGLKMPIQVRKIRGGYELIAGQGRLQAFRELRRETIPAVVLNVPEREIVGRFLAENVMRKKLPWQDKARLIKRDFDRIGRDLTRAEIQEVADRYFIEPPHVLKLLRILQQASPNVKDSLEEMTVDEARELTSLPSAGQDIVVETMREEALPVSQVAAVVRRAKELTQDGDLSKTALKASLRRVGEDLERQRKQLKLYRLHHALGPQNLTMLLSDKTFRRAVLRECINVSKFEDAV